MNTLLSIVKAVLFASLLFLRPLVSGLGSVISGVCLFGFMFCLLFAREHTTPMFAFLALGVGLIAFMRLYDGLMSWMAPDDLMVISRH